MCVVKRAVLLLLLAAVSVSAMPEDCDALKPVSREHLSQVFGDWVLVWSVSSNETGEPLLTNLTSSFLELHPTFDNNTLAFDERNHFKDNSCTKFVLNLTVPAEDSENFHLHSSGGTHEKDGVHSPYEHTADVEFYKTCEESLTVFYKGTEGHFLLHYRKEGHHKETEKWTTVHEKLQKLAECHHFPLDHPFVYDGVADHCPKAAQTES